MNCVQALAVAAAALATAGLPMEAHLAQARSMALNIEAKSYAAVHAAADEFAEFYNQAREAPESKSARVAFGYAPDSWIQSATRHPL
jgi:hypothetical protein